MIAESAPQHVTSAAKLGRLFGLSERSIQRYVQRGMPYRDGRYEVSACRAWIAENVQDDRAGGDLHEQLKRAELEKTLEQARAARLKNDETERNLVNREVVERNGAELCVMVKTRLEQMPDELEMGFPADRRAELKAEITDRIKLILSEMASWEPWSDEEE